MVKVMKIEYEFVFDQAKFTDNLIPAGAEFDIRVSFQNLVVLVISMSFIFKMNSQ